ncbi:reverse transcriptase domain-containing protein [Tanacetum coccineum]|uniref:Reverse transcriptase domain-containing protein n=1 Tax=Tanacetum coccineum TaxID=301880 RepID=A0ABQ4ZYL7_9ASTR
MSTNKQTPLSQPTSVVRNTLGKEPVLQDPGMPIPDEALRKYCDMNYHQILPIIAEKVHQEKVQQEKLKAVKARLDFEEASHHSESGTPIIRKGLKERLGPRYVRSRSGSPEPRRGRSESPMKKGPERKAVFKRLEKDVFHRLGDRGRVASESASERRYNKRASSRRMEELSESKGSAKGHWKSKLKRRKSSIKDDLSQPWTKRWAMPTWCHMFNSTLTGNARVWFDDLPKESIDSYDDLKKAFLENYLQQKKCIKDPVKIHNIRQRDGESTEEFVLRYKLECRDVKGALECMRISEFMHGITNPKLIKRLHDKIPKSVDEMMRVTTTFLRGEVAASNRERKKSFPSWKQQEANQKQNFKKGGFRNQQRSERKQDRFTLLTKTPKEIFGLDKGKFQAPPPMTTPVEKQNHAKFCEFHGEVGHNTDECMHLRKQIEEMLKAGKLSHLIKEHKQNNRKEQPEVTKKGETSGKDKPLTILMVQPWERVARQRITQSFSPNLEIFFPPLGEDKGTEGPMIIEAEIGGHCIHRMYVDGGSASESLYEHYFIRFRPEIKNQLIPTTTPLIGFSGEVIWPIGQIQLLVKIGDEEHSASAWMNFVVVRSPSPYNGIIGRPGVRKLQAVPSTAHGMLKIPVEGGVITLKSSKLVPLECAMVSGPEGTPSATKPIIEERVKVAINPEYPEQTVMIGSTLTEEGRNKLCNLLQQNLDIFAWKPADMTGVPRHIAEHRLNVREGCSPVRQKKRGQAADRNQAIQEEVEKLVEAGIMKEVHYHDWLSNPVMIKKHDDSWRMCVDFKDLNKACPKDGYPLPEIDWKVESLCGFPFKCFLDAYKGYHQIQMAKEDEEKTAFITSQGIFCYTKMPFGLRNAGATYQRPVNKAFHKQIGRNLEVYMDNLVIKSRMENEIVRDIEETFKTLREINMKLNPKKYTFGVEDGMLIGYKVNTKGLKVCPDKVDVVLSLPSPKCLKEKSDYHWTAKDEEAFRQMKQLIAELPMLTAPMEKEELIVYLAAAKETVSVVLMTERKGKQMPIYFLSRALRGPEVNYTSMEKLVLALNRPRVSVKRQILADFIVEIPEEDSPDTPMEVEEELPKPWILFTDGSSCTDGSGAGLILTNPEGMEFTYALRFRFDATNNEAEYEALIVGLRMAEQMAASRRSQSDKSLEARTKKADALNKITSTSFAHLSKQVLVEELKEKLIGGVEILAVVEEEGDTWMTPVLEYLTEETLPADEKEAKAVRRKSQRFAIINGILYKKSFLGLWIRPLYPKKNLDLLEEKRDQAAIREAKSKAKMEKYYNSKVQGTSFKPGDLVYCINDASRAEDTGKLSPKWEGPYEVTEALGKGAYKLRDRDGKQLPQT